MDDEDRADVEPPPMQCEAAEFEDEDQADGPSSDEPSLEEAGYGYGV